MLLRAAVHPTGHDPHQEDITSFLNSIDLHHLGEEQENTFHLPTTPHELSTALNHVSNKKATVHDGFPAEPYKHFWITVL